MKLYFGSNNGTVWTLKRSWGFGFFPVGTRDLQGRFYIFYLDYDSSQWNIKMLTSDDGITWGDDGTIVKTDVYCGDIGTTILPEVTPYGRILVSFWEYDSSSSTYVRKVMYSDDRGNSWTEVTV